MKEYPDYPVNRVRNLTELMLVSAQMYDTHTVFWRMHEKMTWKQWEENVLSVAGFLVQYRDCYILINAEDPILFSIGYFATVISGNIAVLREPNHNAFGVEEPPISRTLTDAVIKKLLFTRAVEYSALPQRSADKVCTIVYSSGTTNASKGVMLSQTNLCNNVISGLEKYEFRTGDRLIQLIPYYHAFGLVCDLLAPLLSGTTICVLDNKMLLFSQMPFFRPTILNAPPAIAQALLTLAKHTGKIEQITGGHLRKILCGGAGLPAEVTEELLQYNIKALGCYGLSECSPCVSVNRDEYYKPGSAGICLNCNQVVIAHDGEILICGSNVMLGYYGDINLTKSVLIDGVYHTGDLGYFDAEGFLYVIGRKNSVIVFDDGTKCMPETLEKQIMTNPLVKEVVVFAKHYNGALSLCARVHIEEEWQREVVEKYIRDISSNQPFARIEFSFSPLPKTKTGKLRRNL